MMKKRSEETQTLRAGCSKAEPKIFSPPQTLFPGVLDRRNLISWRWSLPFTCKRSLVRIDARNFEFRGNRPTNKHSHKPTHRQDRYNTLRRS